MMRIDKLVEILSCEETVLDPDDVEALAHVIEQKLQEWENEV